MLKTSVPTAQVFYPCLNYTDAHAAMEWLGAAFGFERREVFAGPDGTVFNALLGLGGGVIMVGSARDGGPNPRTSPRRLGGNTAPVFVYVDDPDTHCARARAAGAQIAVEPHDTGCGAREYAAYDPEGYWWTFGTYRP